MDGRTNIRIRACLAIVEAGKILLVPHYYLDGRPTEWFLPGGGVQFGEQIQEAAVREFLEETGLEAACGELLGISEAIEPEVPWHGVTIAFRGHVVGGMLKGEASFYSQYGNKTPQWIPACELSGLRYKPHELVNRAFDL